MAGVYAPTWSTMDKVTSLRSRLPAITGVLLGAPVCAEYLQAYLPDTGDIVVMVLGLLILGPLYGGAALLIREVALVTGRGWPGVLLLAAAFGLAMTGLIDGSMWQERRPDVPYWDELRSGTLIESLGFAAFPVVSWVSGHVLFSIGAPLALLEALAPRQRGRLLLGRVGLVVMTGLWLAAAALIRFGEDYEGVPLASPATWWTLAVVVLLASLAFTPLGLPVRPREVRAARSPVVVAAAVFIALAVIDLAALPTWTGTGVNLGVLAAAGAAVHWASRSDVWGLPQVTAMGVAAIVERVLAGLLAPLPEGVTVVEKAAQSAVLILGVTVVAGVAWRRRVLLRGAGPHVC